MSPLFLGTRKGLFIATRGEDGWKITHTAFLGTSVPMLLPDARDGRLYAAVEHGHFGTKLHASADGGATWEETGCPVYPPKPAGVADTLCPMRQTPVPWNLEKIWSLEAGGADQPGVLWCGTIPGGLFKSTDAGATWSLVESLWNDPLRAQWFGGGYDWPGIHSICVDPRDSQRLLIAISCGGVWETRDGGTTWQISGEGLVATFVPPDQMDNPAIQDAHRISRCAAQPDVIWMQHHNGIFRSQDAGRTWAQITNVQPSDFGFVVAAHPTDPLSAWFVPGQGDDQRTAPGGSACVTRTRDGGQTFQASRSGLPQDHAYHLVYRHGLEASRDASLLAFGSTTGSVWISEDGGESWQRLSADLPPVYCVRFLA